MMCHELATSCLNAMHGYFCQEERSWKGFPRLCLNTCLTISSPQPGLEYKIIFIKWPHSEIDSHFVPHPPQYQGQCRGDNFVDMPFSKDIMFPVPMRHEEDGVKCGIVVLQPRWSVVQFALKKPMQSFQDIRVRILEYNRLSQLNFSDLNRFFKKELDLDNSDLKVLFEETLTQMAKLCLELPKLITQPIPLLRKFCDSSVTFSQRQIASLLANAFFCTFPQRFSAKGKYSSYPTINFNQLFSNLDNQHGIQEEKLKCLFHYFRAMNLKKPEDETLVTFHRHFIPYQSLPDWHKSKKQLTELHINAKGTIEDDGFGMLQVDFANALVGGGVLGHGCVQEEIRFLISPELILSRLFTERLSGNECLVVTGFERFSKYSGYASSFKFDGAYHDDTPIDKGSKHRKTRMVAIDALPPGHSSSQYSPQNVQRELNKAFVGFKNYNPSVKNPVAVATGNWGCGAFGGDPQLKGLLQIMAASEARRDVAYFTFSNRKLRDQIHEMHTLLKSRKLTVGQICSMICQYHIHCTEESSLYEFIQNQLNCCFGTNRKVPAKGKKTPKKATPQTDKITGVCTGNKTTQAEATTSALTSPTNKSTKVEPTEDPLPRAKSNKEIITGCCISIEGNPKQENVQDNTESLAKADVRKEAMDVDEADIIPLGDSVDSSGTRDEDLKRDR